MSETVPATAPVLMIVFRRPHTTRQVFEAVRAARPAQLFVASNAAHPGRPSEQEAVEAVQRIVADVDWPCEVYRLFRERQLAAKESISSAIDWFFAHVPAGIVLEDDCLPDRSFFPYCSELLVRFRDDRRIGMISGDNFQFGARRGNGSYYFSRYAHIWGWATWADRWHEGMDIGLQRWPEMARRILALFPNRVERAYWRHVFSAVHGGKIDTWDYQWFFAQLAYHRLCVIPQCNLVSNIGFDAGATNTWNASPAAGVGAEMLAFPMAHPDAILPDLEADALTFAKVIRPSVGRVARRVLRVVGLRGQ